MDADPRAWLIQEVTAELRARMEAARAERDEFARKFTLAREDARLADLARHAARAENQRLRERHSRLCEATTRASEMGRSAVQWALDHYRAVTHAELLAVCDALDAALLSAAPEGDTDAE